MKRVARLAFFAAIALPMMLLAQITNSIRADIERFENQTNFLVVKGFGSGGELRLESGTLGVRLKDSYNPDFAQRMQAIVITYSAGEHRERATIDYDEIETLLRGLDYLRSVNYDSTGLPGFEAAIQTRDGFRAIAFGSHRQSSVEHSIQFDDCARIALNSDQFVQLRNIIAQARTTLDQLRPPK